MTDPSRQESEADRAAVAGDLGAAQRNLERALEAGPPSLELWTKLSAVRRALGDLDGALAAIDQALALSPLDFSALLARAMLLERMDGRGVGEAFSNALAQLPPSAELPRAMAAAVEHARRRSDEHRASLERRLLNAVPDGLDETQRSRLERLASNASRRTRHFHQEPTNFHLPGMPEVEFHNPAVFAGVKALEAATGQIRDEYEALVRSERGELVPYARYSEHVPLAQWKELNNNLDWTAIHLIQNGREVTANARHCPRTLGLLADLPQPKIPGAAPNSMFSLLAPRTRIPPHTGVANVRLVAHLPLIVPPGCRLRVGETVHEWEVGKLLVFDDTIEHEAWNDSDELRVVLIFDLWAPSLVDAEREAVAKLIGAAGVTFKGA